MPRIAALLVALMLVGGGARAAEAQPSLGADGTVGWGLSARGGVTWLDGSAIPVATLAATLRLSPSLEVGAESTFGLGSTRPSSAGPADRSELSAGYGGLLVRWRPAGDASGLRWGGSLLVGAGRARVRSPGSESPVAFENFLVLEPRVNLLAYQERSLRVSAAVGYRIASSATVLPGVGVSGLRGPTLVIGAQLVRDP